MIAQPPPDRPLADAAGHAPAPGARVARGRALTAAAMAAVVLLAFGAPVLQGWIRRLPEEPDLVYLTFGEEAALNDPLLQGVISGWRSLRVAGDRRLEAVRSVTRPAGLESLVACPRRLRLWLQAQSWSHADDPAAAAEATAAEEPDALADAEGIPEAAAACPL